MRKVASYLAVAAVLVAGCADPADPESDAQTTTGVDEPAAPTSAAPAPVDTSASPAPTEPAPTDPGSDEDEPVNTTTPASGAAGLAGDAVADLAARLRVDAAAIEVVQSEQVTWPDGALGCPKPGEFYTQALVEGFRFVLQHDGRVFLYHAADTGPVFLCESGEKNGGYDFVPPPGIHD